MLDFVFKKNLWSLDLIASVVFAVCAGYFLQFIADSGEIFPSKLALAAIIGGSSYILAYLFSLLRLGGGLAACLVGLGWVSAAHLSLRWEDLSFSIVGIPSF